MTNHEIYQEGIEKAHVLISNSIEEFSDLVIQLGMSGEFAEASDLFAYGDDVVLSVGDFLNADDQRVQEMIKILNCLRDAQDSLFK